MKKLFLFLLTSITFLSLAACSKPESNDIVTSMFPQYSITKKIVGDKLRVKLLYPPAVDIHNYELSSHDLISINNSKLFFYTSNIIEPKIAQLHIKNTKVINLETKYNFDHHEEHDHANHDEHDHAITHYWTSIENLIIMVQAIYDEVILIDSVNKDYYLSNLNILLTELETLKSKFITLISNSIVKEIFFAGHNSMEAFAHDIGLTITPLVDDIKPNADVTSNQIVTLVNKIKASNSKYLFIPELESERLADTISRALAKDGITIEIFQLHGFHNITKNEYNENITIIDLINQNYNNIQRAIIND